MSTSTLSNESALSRENMPDNTVRLVPESLPQGCRSLKWSVSTVFLEKFSRLLLPKLSPHSDLEARACKKPFLSQNSRILQVQRKSFNSKTEVKVITFLS